MDPSFLSIPPAMRTAILALNVWSLMSPSHPRTSERTKLSIPLACLIMDLDTPSTVVLKSRGFSEPYALLYDSRTASRVDEIMGFGSPVSAKILLPSIIFSFEACRDSNRGHLVIPENPRDRSARSSSPQ